MEELMAIYKESLHRLAERHDQLVAQRSAYDKRVLLLEEEMDELQEVMCMMRPYLEERSERACG